MARPSRIEFAGAVYHITSHCEPGLTAFAGPDDRQAMRDLLAQTMHRFDGKVLAYCLLPDHFHLLLYTAQANLSRLMRHLGGIYTQHHNRRHGSGGNLFRGRFKAILLDRETVLLDACRYVELNPLRLGLVAAPADWPGSSYAAHAGLEAAPHWLDVDGLHSFVLGRPVRTAAERRRAAERYAKLVLSEPGLQLWPGRLQQQIFLGDAAFVARMQALTGAERLQRGSVKPAAGLGRPGRAGNGGKGSDGGNFAAWLRDSSSREQALYRAHTEGGQTMTTLAAALGLSVSRVSRLIGLYEREQGGLGLAA